MSDVYDENGGERVELSPAGLRRREEILRSAVREGRAVHRRRVHVRTAGCVAVLLVAAVIIPRLHSSRSTPAPRQLVHQRPNPAPKTVVHRPTPEPKHQVIVQRIATDPTLVDRLAVPAHGKGWQTLSDEEFLRQLDRAGRPAALAYVGGEERVLWREPHRPAAAQ